MESVKLPMATKLDPEFILGQDGPIASSFKNYEPRPSQILMSKTVLESMLSNLHLFCEAGTGTGKSYAFLIPAIELALKGESPIVISTNTISLQEQIYNKDIPDLKKFLNLPELKVVLRKGRGNYISKRRHKNAQNFPWEVKHINEIEDIDRWVEKTNIGTVQDLDFIPSSNVWDEVKSDQYDCLGTKCPHYSSCFYFKSKEEAEKAHIIITNHSLLTLDLMLKKDTSISLLPKFKHLIIDEAHALEEAIRKADTFEWKQNSASYLIKMATNKKKTGFLDVLLENPDITNSIDTRTTQIIEKLKQFVEDNELFFQNDVIPFIKSSKIKNSDSRRIKPGELNSKYTFKVMDTLDQINKLLRSVASELKRISEEDNVSSTIKQLATLIEKYSGRTKEVESSLNRTINSGKDLKEQYPSYVSSVEASASFNDKTYYQLVSTPIFVKQTTREVLFNRIPSIILTSATLTTNNSFSLICRNLGTIEEKTATIKLPEVFNYKEQVKLILTPDLPEDPWNNQNEREKYFDKVANKIDKYVKLTNGNAFILCNSYVLLNALYNRTEDEFERQGFNVLKQGGGFTNEQIIDEFKRIPNSVLFGVDSFWTGVDVPGDHLQNVIIPKLPFPPPTPLSEAQEEMYALWNKGKPRNKQRNFFSDRTVPAVATKIQQGFGRLIRHKTDTGIVVILDPRMKTKPYGKIILQSLPQCNIIID